MKHHPDSVAKRNAESHAKWEAKQAKALAPLLRLQEMSLALHRIACCRSIKEANQIAAKVLNFKKEQ